LKLTVPYYDLPFVYVACSSLECGVYLYSEGFVDEGEETRQEGEDKDAAMLSRHNRVDILFFNGLQ